MCRYLELIIIFLIGTDIARSLAYIGHVKGDDLSDVKVAHTCHANPFVSASGS